jgi:hypothetical protein
VHHRILFCPPGALPLHCSAVLSCPRIVYGCHVWFNQASTSCFRCSDDFIRCVDGLVTVEVARWPFLDDDDDHNNLVTYDCPVEYCVGREVCGWRRVCSALRSNFLFCVQLKTICAQNRQQDPGNLLCASCMRMRAPCCALADSTFFRRRTWLF